MERKRVGLVGRLVVGEKRGVGVVGGRGSRGSRRMGSIRCFGIGGGGGRRVGWVHSPREGLGRVVGGGEGVVGMIEVSRRRGRCKTIVLGGCRRLIVVCGRGAGLRGAVVAAVGVGEGLVAAVDGSRRMV